MENILDHASGGCEPKSDSISVQPRLEVDMDNQRITLMLDVDIHDAMDQGTQEHLEDLGFVTKPEFHVTVLDIKQGSRQSDSFSQLDAQTQQSIMNLLSEAQLEKWRITARDEYFALKKLYENEPLARLSVIRMVDCPGLDTFYESLNRLVGSESSFEAPPAHVTLATKAGSRGIGLTTESELSKIGTPFTF